MNIKVVNGKSGIEIKQDGDRVFITGTYNGKTSKSKKGHWNMSWHNREMFEEAIRKYIDGDEGVEEQDQETPF